MNNPYQLVIFDWEGTIADSLGQVLCKLAREAERLGLGKIDPYSVKQYVSLGLEQAILKIFPEISLTQQEQLMQAVEQSMSAQSHVCLIPGVTDFIKQLQLANMDLAIATNKGQYSLQRALEATGLDEIFKVTRCAGQVPAKPCPQMLEEIMAQFNQVPAHTLMIGDSLTDIEMAKNCHMDAIGVDFYNHQRLELQIAGACAIFDDYRQLADFLGLPAL